VRIDKLPIPISSGLLERDRADRRSTNAPTVVAPTIAVICTNRRRLVYSTRHYVVLQSVLTSALHGPLFWGPDRTSNLNRRPKSDRFILKSKQRTKVRPNP